MKATLNYTDHTTKVFYLVSPKGDKGDTGLTGPVGPIGPRGPVGSGLVVKGTVNNASQLPKSGNQDGYCYFIGTDLYVWDAGAWKNCGSVSPDLSNYVTITDLNNGLSNKVTDNKDGTEQLNGVRVQPFNKLSDTIGGRNLLIGTATPMSITGNNIVNQAANTYYLVGGISFYSLRQKYGSTFTLSFDWSTVDTANAYAGTMQQQFNGPNWLGEGLVYISSSNTSGHVTETFSLDNNSANVANGFRFRLDNVPTTSTITVSNMKLERGSIATDWTPAPEDKADAPLVSTLQTQVDNSAVGTNLLLNTGGLSSDWTLGQGVTVDTSQNPTILHYPINTSSSMNFLLIAQQQLNDGLLQPSTTYTASFYAKGTGTFIFYCFPSVSEGAPDTHTNITLTSDYKLYTITFTTIPNISGNKGFLLRQDYSSSATDQNTVEAYIYGFKLEKGSVATDWCPNLEDKVNVADMRKPASDIAGIEEVNAKQDKIGYTPADDSKVFHSTVTQLNSTDMNTVRTAGFYQLNSGTNGMPNADAWTIYQVILLSGANGVQLAYQTNNIILGMRSWNLGSGKISFSDWVQFADGSKVVHDNHDNTITANSLTYDLSKTGLTPVGLYNSGSFNDLPLGTVYAPSWVTDGPGSSAFITTTFYFSDWGGVKTQIAIANSTNLMYFRVKIGASWNSWVLVSDDSKVAHLSGANNFDTVPTVKNNPLLLASSLPSDLATTTDVNKAVNTATSNFSKHIEASKNNEDSAISDSTKGNSNDIYYWTEG